MARYKYRVLAKRVTDGDHIWCESIETGEIRLMDVLEFTYLLSGLEIDTSNLKKFVYGKDIPLDDDIPDEILKGSPTLIYATESDEGLLVVLRVGYLVAKVLYIPHDDYVSFNKTFEELVVCCGSVMVTRFADIMDMRTIKGFFDNADECGLASKVATPYSEAFGAEIFKSIKNSDDIIAVYSRGIVSLNSIQKYLNQLALSDRKTLDRYIKSIGAFLIRNTLESEILPFDILIDDEGLDKVLRERQASNIDDDDEEDEDELPPAFRITKVIKKSTRSFDVVLASEDEDFEMTATELQFNWLLYNNRISSTLSYMELDTVYAKSAGLLIKLDSSIELEGFTEDDSLQHCLVCYKFFAPMLFTYIDGAMSTDVVHDKVLDLATRNIFSKFEDEVSCSIREVLEMSSDFLTWVDKNNKYRKPEEPDNVTDKRYEGITPIITGLGYIRASTFSSWYKKRDAEYKKHIKEICFGIPTKETEVEGSEED